MGVSGSGIKMANFSVNFVWNMGLVSARVGSRMAKSKVKVIQLLENFAGGFAAGMRMVKL